MANIPADAVQPPSIIAPSSGATVDSFKAAFPDATIVYGPDNSVANKAASAIDGYNAGFFGGYFAAGLDTVRDVVRGAFGKAPVGAGSFVGNLEARQNMHEGDNPTYFNAGVKSGNVSTAAVATGGLYVGATELGTAIAGGTVGGDGLAFATANAGRVAMPAAVDTKAAAAVATGAITTAFGIRNPFSKKKTVAELYDDFKATGKYDDKESMELAKSEAPGANKSNRQSALAGPALTAAATVATGAIYEDKVAGWLVARQGLDACSLKTNEAKKFGYNKETGEPVVQSDSETVAKKMWITSSIFGQGKLAASADGEIQEMRALVDKGLDAGSYSKAPLDLPRSPKCPPRTTLSQALIPDNGDVQEADHSNFGVVQKPPKPTPAEGAAAPNGKDGKPSELDSGKALAEQRKRLNLDFTPAH